jgi:hypothetical protein
LSARPSSSSTPVAPGSLSAKGTFFSSSSTGAWSLTSASIVPSARPWAIASRSRPWRSGGSSRIAASYQPMSTSVRCRLWMLASAVTASPSALARRTNPTPAALLRRQRCSRAPVSRASSKKVARAIVSAIAGMPARPMRVASSPLAATPWPSQASFGRSQAVKPKVAAYCSARCSTDVSRTGTSACEKPTHPASRSAAISVSTSPPRPRVSAPSGCSRASSSPRARNFSISTRPGSSSTGSVSGGQTMLVTPPATAAASSEASMPSCS